MDPRSLAILIPIFALAIPIGAIIMGSLVKMKKLALEEAKVRAGSLGGTGEHELAQMRGEIDQLRTELNEVHERLDFTERLLARGDHGQLGRPSGSPQQ
jgi:hypothetical protein